MTEAELKFLERIQQMYSAEVPRLAILHTSCTLEAVKYSIQAGLGLIDSYSIETSKVKQEALEVVRKVIGEYQNHLEKN